MSTVIFDPRKKKDEEDAKPKTVAELIGVALALATIPLVFMLLWNWLMPRIFGLTTIGYLKSFGLLAMSYMIFKK